MQENLQGRRAVPDRSIAGVSSWYVARIQPRKEGIAAMHLERQGFRVFCPKFQKIRRHARRIDSVLSPLFPGYLFVRLRLDQPGWRSVNGTIGVIALLGDPHGRPASMPDAVMTALLLRCPEGLYQAIQEPLIVGEAVRITTGPFADFTARVSALDSRGRVQLLLDVLGGGIFQCAVEALERV